MHQRMPSISEQQLHQIAAEKNFKVGAVAKAFGVTPRTLQNTFWAYDSFGRVTNKADNLNSNLFIYKYDGLDRLTNRWTPAKGNTYYAYSAVGNLTNVNYPSTPDVSFAWDAMNR